MAAANALIDPLSNSAANAAEGAPSNTHRARSPMDNGVNTMPANLAGAGAGQGPGGSSTPFAAGGGGGAGGGAGPAAAGFTSAELAAMTGGANNAGTAPAPAIVNAGPASENAATTPTASANTMPATHAEATAATIRPADTPSGPVPFTIYSTGVDNSGALLADGSSDSHYQIIAAPASVPLGDAAVVNQSSFPFHGYSPWKGDGDGLSKWIGPYANETNDPAGTYTYQTTFDLTGYDSSTAVITGQYLADDWLDEIDLNGQPVYTFTHGSGDPGQYKAWQTLPQIAGNFVPGVNTLDFVVENRVQAANNPGGFRVELQGTADKLAWQGPAFSWTQTPAANPSVTALADQTNTEGDNVSLQVQPFERGADWC